MKKILFILSACIGIITLILIDQWQVKLHQEQIILKSNAILNQCNIRFEEAIKIRFNSVEALGSFFFIHPETTPEEFSHFAEKMISFNPPIRALQFADDMTRVIYVYPPNGNEITVLDPMTLITDPHRGPFVKKAIETKKATVHGPFELRQGGMGLVLRHPIFSGKKLVGLAIGVFDVPAIIQEALIGLDTSQFSFQLSDSKENVFWGADQTLNDPLKRTIIVGDGQWQMAMQPTEGNTQQFYLIRSLILICGAGFLIILSAFIYYLSSRSKRLQTYIDRQTSELLEKNISLKNEIEERKIVETRLVEREAKFRSVFDKSPIGIELYDSKGTLIELNTKCLEIFGIKNIQDVIGFKLFEDPNLSDKIKARILNGEAASYETTFNFDVVKSHNLYPTNRTDKIDIELFITPWKPSPAHDDQFLIHVVDISKRKKAEKQRIKDQEIIDEHKKLAFVGKIAGKMAHDFNNILSIIMGTSEISMVDCKDPDLHEAFKLIFDQTLRGKNLTRNLVAFAKDQDPSRTFFNVDEKINLVLVLLRKDLDGIELIKEEKPGIPELLADSGMIEHAIVNLIQNAIHAVSKTLHPRIVLRTYASETEICVEIEDNGCGIPSEYVEKIYSPAFTLKGSKDITESYEPEIKGTGYGMANVKKYIDQHNGRILVESKINFGTKFTICLPVIKKELTDIEKSKIRETATQFNKYILLVEDEIAISEIQYAILTGEPCSHKVDVANNGQAALDLISRNAYDLISLDYILPGQINGMDVYNSIRKTDKKVPILFVSGNIEFIESIKNLKQEDKRIDHVSKPCTNEAYIKSINALLVSSIN